MTWAAELLCLVTILGLIARRRYRLCYSLLAYLGANFISDVSMLLWPERFGNRTFWLWTVTLAAVLLLGVALELSFRILPAIPGERPKPRRIVLTFLPVTFVAVMARAASRAGPYLPGPRASNGWRDRSSPGS